MYRLRHFKEIYGKCWAENVDSFTNYSIYDFYPLSLENLVNNVIQLFTPCKTVYLHWLYWYVLLLCIVKIVSEFIHNFNSQRLYSLSQFNSICEINAVFGKTRKFNIFRDRQLSHVSNRWRCKLRQFVVCLISIMDLYLALGILMVILARINISCVQQVILNVRKMGADVFNGHPKFDMYFLVGTFTKDGSGKGSSKNDVRI